MKIFEYLGVLVKYGPLALRLFHLAKDLIVLVETLRSNAAGQQKKEAVLMGIEKAASAMGYVIPPAVYDAISKGLDLTVSLLNLRGELRHVDAPKEELSPQEVEATARKVAETVKASDARLDQLEAMLKR